MKQSKEVSAYIASFPAAVQKLLKQARVAITKAAPKAEEGMSYGMPGYKLNGKPLVYFAAWKTHLGFYALPSGNAAFKRELSKYKISKGTVQFPLDKVLPVALITKMVKYRIKENLGKQSK